VARSTVVRERPAARRSDGAWAVAERVFPVVLVPASLVTLVVSLGFFAQVPWATRLWPWPATPLSYIFIGSMLSAIAIPLLWIGVSGETAAVQAGALDLTVMFGGMFIYVLTLLGDASQPRLWPYALVFCLACLGSIASLVWSRGVAWKDSRPMPSLVRGSFAVFAVVLVAAGAALVFHSQIFPWHLAAENSVMFGLSYLGAATYFVYAVLVPRWSNAVGQLAGFLAYDVVLLAPFLGQLTAVRGGQLVSLIIYLTVLSYSGVVAAYYLFIATPTRLGAPRR
jgi:hypothetical protein